MVEKSKKTRGHSHTPQTVNGLYKVGASPTGRLGYNTGASAWQQPSKIGAQVRKSVLSSLRDDMFGEGEMCGACKLIHLGKQHNPNTDRRRVCTLCGTDWFGIEPGNDRRGAIEAQKARTSGEKSPPKI
jgi:hypothetical protein